MTDIFISYANEDRDSAARLAARLEAVGWRVWWDRRIPAGRTWRSVLAEALAQTSCMIVLWSAHSIDSPWVGEEAEEARRLGKTLVPVLIERVEPPMGFRTIQAADLAGWKGAPDDLSVRQLIADLKSLLGAPSEPSDEKRETFAPAPRKASLPEILSRHGSKAAVGGLAILVIFAFWYFWPIAKQEPGVVPIQTHEERAQLEPAPQLEKLAVRSPRRTLEPSETLNLNVTGNYSDGSEKDIRDGVEWSSSDTRVATVTKDGAVRAMRNGTTNIVARVGAVGSSEWTLTVEAAKAAPPPTAPRLVALKVSSNKNELIENEKIGLRAKARYSDNTEKYIDGGILWQSSDVRVASINTRGELQGLRPGKVEVIVRTANFTSAPQTFLVREAPEKFAPQIKPVKSTPPPVKPAVLTEPAKAKIAGYVDRAQSYREQGNYAAALAELEQARLIDSTSAAIRQEIEQTKRACNAEKVLGNKPNC